MSVEQYRQCRLWIDWLASVAACEVWVVWAAGLLGCLRVWRLPGLPAEASTGEATQSGRQADGQSGRVADRRAVTSNFSGTGIESCGTALHGPWVLGPWPLVVATRSASPGRPHFQTVARRLGRHVEGLWRCLAQSAMPPLPTAGPAGPAGLLADADACPCLVRAADGCRGPSVARPSAVVCRRLPPPFGIMGG
jgi:hypothetical protein